MSIIYSQEVVDVYICQSGDGVSERVGGMEKES